MINKSNLIYPSGLPNFEAIIDFLASKPVKKLAWEAGINKKYKSLPLEPLSNLSGKKYSIIKGDTLFFLALDSHLRIPEDWEGFDPSEIQEVYKRTYRLLGRNQYERAVYKYSAVMSFGVQRYLATCAVNRFVFCEKHVVLDTADWKPRSIQDDPLWEKYSIWNNQEFDGGFGRHRSSLF